MNARQAEPTLGAGQTCVRSGAVHCGPDIACPASPVWLACDASCCGQTAETKLTGAVTSVGFVDSGTTRRVVARVHTTHPPPGVRASAEGDIWLSYTCDLAAESQRYCGRSTSHATSIVATGPVDVFTLAGRGPGTLLIDGTQVSVSVTAPRGRLRTDIGPMIVERPAPARPTTPPPAPLES